MRLRAGIATLLLAPAGCAHRPEHVIIDVDGYRVEVGKKEPAGGK